LGQVYTDPRKKKKRKQKKDNKNKNNIKFIWVYIVHRGQVFLKKKYFLLAYLNLITSLLSSLRLCPIN
jgi:hypothetical protein